MPIKNLAETGAWAYTGTAQFFEYPPIISGMDKATNFKFGRYIHRVHANKSPLKIWEKMEHERIQGLPKFFVYPLLFQERVKLQTSNFVRTFLVSIGTKAHYKFRESSRVRSQDSENVSGQPYIGRIARSSLR